MLGWLAAVALPSVVSVIGAAAGDLIGPTSAALAFMLTVVGVALIGGLSTAVLARPTRSYCGRYGTQGRLALAAARHAGRPDTRHDQGAQQ